MNVPDTLPAFALVYAAAAGRTPTMQAIARAYRVSPMTALRWQMELGLARHKGRPARRGRRTMKRRTPPTWTTVRPASLDTLSPGRRRLLWAIRAVEAVEGRAPSCGELGRALGISGQRVWRVRQRVEQLFPTIAREP